ncbi:hypothetical protein F4809DRAFT_43554 [Biscogniauxia mediterranea]|nr:hypothetical protein F4809DRAFT_43554 [Biscogniauxia mediterranea]
MLSRTVTTFAILAIAGHAVAEPVREPYQPEFVRMSTRSLFHLSRREDGYAPEQEICGDGATCSEACGKGYQQCASKDNLVHCYDTANKQTCCPGNTGSSCDDGYFCSTDQDGATWCCPDSMTLQECAKKYGLPGTLTSETPSATSVPSSTSSQSPATTTSTSSVSASVSTIAGSGSTHVSANCTTYTSTMVQSFIPTSSTFNATSTQAMNSSTSVSTPITSTSPASSTSTANIITLTDTPIKTTASPTAPSNSIALGAASSNGPASSLALLLAGALAALF